MPDPVMVEPQPFFFVAHHAAHTPEAVALSTFERDFTYREVEAYATSIAGLLRRRGVRPGQLVVAQLRNELNLLFMEAVYHEAAIWASYSGPVRGDDPIFADWFLAHEAAEGVEETRTILVDEAFMTDVARAEHHDAPRRYESVESICRVSFTSGTTGRPLPVGSTVARQARPAQGWLETRPFFSLIRGFSGSGAKTANAMMFHGDTYICPGEPDQNVTLAQRNFVAALQGSPAQLSEFCDLLAQRMDRHHDIAVVQYIGSFLSERLLTRLLNELGVSVTACYGSNEVGMITQRRDVCDQAANVGSALPGVSIEIVDDSGRTVPIGVDGDVRVRTDRRQTRYLTTSGREDDSLREGWFYPGDVGHLTTEGHLVLSGRSNDVINAGGVKFHPESLEGILLTTAGIHDGALLAMKGDDGFDGYAAVVVCDDAFPLASLVDPLARACGGVPPSHVWRIDRIDRDENGKVRRREIQRRVPLLVARRRDDL